MHYYLCANLGQQQQQPNGIQTGEHDNHQIDCVFPYGIVLDYKYIINSTVSRFSFLLETTMETRRWMTPDFSVHLKDSSRQPYPSVHSEAERDVG